MCNLCRKYVFFIEGKTKIKSSWSVLSVGNLNGNPKRWKKIKLKLKIILCMCCHHFNDLSALNIQNLKMWYFHDITCICEGLGGERFKWNPLPVTAPKCLITGRKPKALGGRERHFLLSLPAWCLDWCRCFKSVWATPVTCAQSRSDQHPPLGSTSMMTRDQCQGVVITCHSGQSERAGSMLVYPFCVEMK